MGLNTVVLINTISVLYHWTKKVIGRNLHPISKLIKNTNQNTSSQQTDSDNVWEDKHSTLKLTGRVKHIQICHG